MTLLEISNIVISVVGALAVALSLQTSTSVRRWGPLLGLLGQPAWFYIGFKTDQQGVVIAAGIFTLSWLIGIWTLWIAPWLEGRDKHPGSWYIERDGSVRIVSPKPDPLRKGK